MVCTAEVNGSDSGTVLQHVPGSIRRSNRVGDRRQGTVQGDPPGLRDRIEAGNGDVQVRGIRGGDIELDIVQRRVGIGVDDGLAQRARAGIGRGSMPPVIAGVGHDIGREQLPCFEGFQAGPASSANHQVTSMAGDVALRGDSSCRLNPIRAWETWCQPPSRGAGWSLPPELPGPST